MRIIRCFNLAFFLFILCISISCSNTDSPVSSSVPVVYEVKANAGTVYKCSIATETSTNIEAEGKKVESTSGTDISLTYTFLNDTTGGVLLKLTYDRLSMHVKSTEAPDLLIDSEDSLHNYDPVNKLFRNLRGAELLISMDKKGRIRQIEGEDIINEHILSSLTGEEPGLRNQVQEQLSLLVGEGFVKDNIQYAFSLFPDTAVRVGNSWSKQVSQRSVVPFQAETTIRLKKIVAGKAELTENTEIRPGGHTPVNVMGQQISTDLTGAQTGNYEVDISTGLLINGTSNTSFKGEIGVLNRKVPVRIKMKRTMKVTPKNDQ